MPIPSLDAILNAARTTFLSVKPVDPDSFALGEIIPVKWVHSLGPQWVLIQVNGKELVAETAFPIPEGAEFQVRVEQLEPRVIFKLLMPTSGGSVSFSLLKKYWVGDPPLEMLAESWEALERAVGPSLPKEVRETWARIQETTRQFSGILESGADPQALARIIDQSGLNLENKLLRLIASDGKPSFPGRAGGGPEKPVFKNEGPIGTGRSGKGRGNSTDPSKDGTLSVIECREGRPLSDPAAAPPAFPQGLRWAEVLFSGDQQGGGPAADRGRELLFLLDLPALGKLQIQIQIRGTRMYGRFKTADPFIGEYLEENVSRLAGRLREDRVLAEFEIRVVDPSLLQEILNRRDWKVFRIPR